ncbi:MAG: carboxypeptidase-like regulatory domain-containing protein [Bacteroidota bacterium]
MTTFPVQNFFPEFVDNQILNKTQLNQLRIYLDEQNRLTRVRLVGIGIVCGLQASISGSVNNRSITLSEGYGLTSEGYLIEIPTTTFVRKRHYNDPHTEDNDLGQAQPVYEPWKIPDDEIDPMDPDPEWQIDIFELMSDVQMADPAFVEEVGNATTNIRQNNLEDRVLVLYLEMNEDPLHSCLVTDCNNKGHNLEMNVRALLVNKEDLEPVLPCPGLGELIDIPRFYAGLYRSSGLRISEISNANQINTAYQDIASHLKDELIDKLGTTITNCSGFLNLEAAASGLPDLDTALTKIVDSPNQYAFDCLKDLAQSYNEFVHLICSLVKDCCPVGTFPRHLMIRDFVMDDASESARWRNEFMPSPVRNVMDKDLKKAEALIHRIFTLANHYDFDFVEAIKITPSENEAHPVGTRALPYYYDYDETSEAWQAAGCCAPPLLAYATNQMQLPGEVYNRNPLHPLNNQIRQKSFLKIEGHFGQDCISVMNALNQYKIDHNLDFNVIALQLQGEAGGQMGLTEDSDLLAIKDLLAENLVDRRAIERIFESLILGENNNVADIIQDLIIRLGQTNDSKLEIRSLHESWVMRRKQLVPPCAIGHLESDYLLLRSETICTYDKLDALLSFLSSFDNVIESLESFNSACIDFDSEGAPPDGTQFEAGQEVVMEDEILVTMIQPAEPFDGESAVMIEEANDFGAGKALELFGLAARFDFSNLSFPPSFILAEFRALNDYIEIQVNDALIYNGPLTELNTTDLSATGYAANVSFNDNGSDDILQGSLFIQGTDINSIAIGGFNLAIDNICALGSTASDSIFNATGLRTLSVSDVEQRTIEMDARISEIRSSDLSNLSQVERQELNAELQRLEVERATLSRTRSLLSIGENFRGIFSARNVAFSNPMGDRRGMLKVRAAIAFQSNNSGQMILISLIYGLIHLRLKIKELIALLPKDLRCFNYCLFIHTYKEIVATMIQIRLLLFCITELLVQNLSNSKGENGFFDNLGENAGAVIQLVLPQIPKVLDVITYWKKGLHNCLHARFVTLYYTLEHTLLGAGDSWQEFMQKNTGAEHLTGVGFGDTFILACENNVGEGGVAQSTVVADFTVSGGIACCCALDPSTICFPPVALPNYDILTIIYNNEQVQGEFPRDLRIDVVNNDFGLNDAPNLSVILPSSTSALGAQLTLNETTNRITYSYNNPEINYGLDTFEYILRDEACGLEDTGQVMVMIKPVLLEIDPPELGGTVVGSSFTGTVVSSATGGPIDEVNVALEGTNFSTFSGSGGEFAFGGVPPGTYQMISSRFVYKTGNRNIIVVYGSNNKYVGNITLNQLGGG